VPRIKADLERASAFVFLKPKRRPTSTTRRPFFILAVEGDYEQEPSPLHMRPMGHSMLFRQPRQPAAGVSVVSQ